MKNMYDSPEIFTAYATIDYGYWAVKKIFDDLQKRDGITKAIDKATGYDKFIDEKLAKELIPILKDIIAAKKVIEGDFKRDEELLQVCKNQLK